MVFWWLDTDSDRFYGGSSLCVVRALVYVICGRVIPCIIIIIIIIIIISSSSSSIITISSSSSKQQQQQQRSLPAVLRCGSASFITGASKRVRGGEDGFTAFTISSTQSRHPFRVLLLVAEPNNTEFRGKILQANDSQSSGCLLVAPPHSAAPPLLQRPPLLCLPPPPHQAALHTYYSCSSHAHAGVVVPWSFAWDIVRRNLRSRRARLGPIIVGVSSISSR